MSDLGHHAEWLSLLDISGPFLAEPVLKDAFPQGLASLDTSKKQLLRQAYDEWREAIDLDERDLVKLHSAWIELVLKEGLELDEDGSGEVLKTGIAVSEELKCFLPEHDITLRPDFVVVDAQQGGTPRMLITRYDPAVALTDALKTGGWNASPAERMVELCRATGVRLGLVTNGEQWMFVDAPVGAVTSFASWYARLWGQEPITLQAFVNLLGIRRFFVDRDSQLPALLDNSLKHQDEVTDALGEQVRRAVEVLIQALDRADVDRNRDLLKGVEPTELYVAGLTVMMRIVFLLSAEERGLLLMGDERYETNYAVSTLRMQLRAETEEILERRWDAWSRLLSIFRAVFGGIDHELMRLPALGGSLFDPDRFPFLEGRAKGSRWKSDPATPLPIDNRTVLLLLDAVQLFQGRTLSYLALDVEQIGHVYEGLLERTVVRAIEATLDLAATKNAKNPWVTLPELDDAAAKGGAGLEELLKDRTGSSASRVKNDLGRVVDDAAADKLLTACNADPKLRDRLKPYFHLLRTDPWGYPLVYPKGTFMVRTGTDRRETGTHYTPKSLTETIVKETLEPVAYVGPAEGTPRQQWQLKSPAELLDLKICDPAMGSGAFLVQVCRWLAERLVESWAQAETNGKAVTAVGEVVDQLGSSEPMRQDIEERLISARRLIAERCLYGVDMNPLAVELAKLSIWLITLSKGRPFGFIDHNLRCGDSLLGINSLEQLQYLDLAPGIGSSKKLFAQKIDEAVSAAIAIRSDLHSRVINDIHDVEVMASLDEKARKTLQLPSVVADALIGEYLAAHGKAVELSPLSIQVGDAVDLASEKIARIANSAARKLSSDLPAERLPRRPLHWPLDFPEVFNREKRGFDAIIGNPPFLGGLRITELYGDCYNTFLGRAYPPGGRLCDLSAYFFRRAYQLIAVGGTFGFLATNTISQGITQNNGLAPIRREGGHIYRAVSSFRWPGTASVIASLVHIIKGPWAGRRYLGSVAVTTISDFLDDTDPSTAVLERLKENHLKCSEGSTIWGDEFLISSSAAAEMVSANGANARVVKPIIGGAEINRLIEITPQRWAIDFGELEEAEAELYREPFEHLRTRIYPVRKDLDPKKYGRVVKSWWKYFNARQQIYQKIRSSGAQRVLGRSRVSDLHIVEWLPVDVVYTDAAVIFLFDDWSHFGVLQSAIHETWARYFASSLKNDMRYVARSCFDTFPFPNNVENNEAISTISARYHDFRVELCRGMNMPRGKLFNLLHDPTVTSDGIHCLRNLTAEMDRAVLLAYGWTDIDLAHDFVAWKGKTRYAPSECARKVLLKRLSQLNGHRFKENVSGGGLSDTPTIGDGGTLEDDMEQDLFSHSLNLQRG